MKRLIRKLLDGDKLKRKRLIFEVTQSLQKSTDVMDSRLYKYERTDFDLLFDLNKTEYPPPQITKEVFSSNLEPMKPSMARPIGNVWMVLHEKLNGIETDSDRRLWEMGLL